MDIQNQTQKCDCIQSESPQEHVTITEEWQTITDYDDKDFTLYSLDSSGKSASMCANMCSIVRLEDTFKPKRYHSFQFALGVFQSIPKHALSASNHCQEESSATLLRILNVDTLLFIGKYMKYKVTADIFIDGNDIAMEHEWKYSDGSDVAYLKWAPGEPNSILCQCAEHCLTLQNMILSLPYFEGMNNMQCRVPGLIYANYTFMADV
ncbi:CD206 [Mytilus edulis]|uniref:MRC n=1 Tax=Mytilus edulis TaxID=6550 RepID=A0A8S3USC6_MYTED|nr:CD206 [Mytilus edulis]